MKPKLLTLILLLQISCQVTKVKSPPKVEVPVERTTYFPKSFEYVRNLPRQENLWVFILAGQSNMAGRGLVEPRDTIANRRILSIDSSGKLIYAKEPIHIDYPRFSGLGCGLSFARYLIKALPDFISVLLLPAAVGSTSISQWLDDALFRNVKLLSNFSNKVQFGKK